MLKNLFWSCVVILVTTACYTALLYKADETDRKVVFNRIKFAYEDGQLLYSPIPFFFRGLASRDNLSGGDQMVESFYALMVMYKDNDKPWMNALNPGLYQRVGTKLSTTEMAKECASASVKTLNDSTIWKVDHKPRFWHGVKAMLLFGFKYLELSQITWLIKISTFFAFTLIALQTMYLDRRVGLAYSAFTFSAFYCSSVLFFGGVAYSVPLLSTALWGVLWLGFRMLPWAVNRNIELIIITLGGTILSFFYQLGGCEIYAMSLIIFVEIFLPKENVSKRTLIIAFESCAFFLFGFFGSILSKHILIVCLTGSFDAVYELVDMILYRMSNTNTQGTKIGFISIIQSQFHWYGIPAYGIDSIFVFVNASKYISLALAAIVTLWICILKYFKKKKESEELAVIFCGFLLMLATVILRYMVLRNHSDIHVFFVNRYLFVYSGVVYFFLVWLIISHRRFLISKT